LSDNQKKNLSENAISLSNYFNLNYKDLLEVLRRPKRPLTRPKLLGRKPDTANRRTRAHSKEWIEIRMSD